MSDEKARGPSELVDPALAAALAAALANLDEGKRAVEDAERALVAVLAELEAAPRAEKRAVSSAIEGALSTVRTARAKVVEAERVLTDKASS